MIASAQQKPHVWLVAPNMFETAIEAMKKAVGELVEAGLQANPLVNGKRKREPSCEVRRG